MTVWFKADWNAYTAGESVTLPAAVEADLVASGVAIDQANVPQFTTGPNGEVSLQAGAAPFKLGPIAGSILVFTRDHAYKPIVGGGGYDSEDAWFKENGLTKYSLTVNTDLDNSVSVGASNGLTWEQVKALQDSGVEITSHGNRHVNSWLHGCTGFTLRYSGAATTDAYAYVDGTSPVNLVLLVDAATVATLSLTTYTTLAALQTAVNAVAGWTMTLADELDGTELTQFIPKFALADKRACKTVDGEIAISGGIVVRYRGTSTYPATANTATIRLHTGGSGYLMFFEDGVERNEFALGTTTTLTAMVASINGMAGGHWEAHVMDNGLSDTVSQGQSFCKGTEYAGQIRGVSGGNYEFMDAYNEWVFLEIGLPLSTVLNKCHSRAISVAAGNGVNMLTASDSGSHFFDEIMPMMMGAGLRFFRMTPKYREIAPLATPVQYITNSISYAGYDDYTGSGETSKPEQFSALIDATADSPGFVVAPFIHQINVDGSSGKNFMPMTGSPAVGNGAVSETKMKALLDRLQANSDKITVMTQVELAARKHSVLDAANLLFNPRFKNTSTYLGGTIHEALAAARTGAHVDGDIDLGKTVPGWGFSFKSTEAVPTIDANGRLRVVTTAAATTNYISAEVILKPGRQYRFAAALEVENYTSGNGILLGCYNASGIDAKQQYPGTAGWLDEQIKARSQTLMFDFFCPPLENKGSYIRGLVAGPWDLSTNKNIQINIDGIGAVAVDCSAGAGSASSVKAWEVANAINAAIKASAAYAGHSQYHTIARAEEGKLVLESPFTVFQAAASGIVTVSDGATANARNTIFGSTTTTGDNGYWTRSSSGRKGMYPYKFMITFNAVGTFVVSNPVVHEVGVFN